MKVHYSSEKQNWETPQDFFDKLNNIFNFTLDSCAEVETAKCSKFYTVEDDALQQDWKGVVWCNPPYGKYTEHFLEKAAMHGNCIALTFARTETKMFFKCVWDKATAILFVKGRLSFYHVTGEKGGTAGAPSVLIAYGNENAEILKNCNIKGRFVRLS